MRKKLASILMASVLTVVPFCGAFAAPAQSIVVGEAPVTAITLAQSIDSQAKIYRNSVILDADDLVATGDVVGVPNRTPREIIVKGDVIGNGRLSLSSLTTMAKGLRDASLLSPNQLRAADMNGNGKLDLTDLTTYARKFTDQSERPAFGTIYQSSPKADEYRKDILNRVNTYRQECGIEGVLVELPALDASAQARAEEVAATGVFDHLRPNGDSWHLIMEYGEPCSVAENMHMSYGYEEDEVPATAMVGWLSSDTHRDAMLSDEYIYAGAGAAQGPDGTWYTVMHYSDSDGITGVHASILSV